MSQWLTILSRVLNGIGSYVVLPALTVLITADVVLRYVFNSPLSWGLEASRYILLLFFLFGLLESFRVGEHVSMELLAAKFSPGVCRAISLLQSAALVFVFALIVKKVLHEIPFLYSLPEVTPELQMRVWAFYAFIAVISCLVIAYVVNAVILMLLGRRNKVEEEEQAAWTE